MSSPSQPYRLRLPGPTEVPERVLKAMAKPVLAHRSDEFAQLLKEASDLAKPLFGTRNDIMAYASTGTGLMEAAAVNVLGQGDRALVLVGGMFSERFASVLQAHGCEVDAITVPWGEAVAPEQVEEKLRGTEYTAVIAVHNETSTGVVSDIAAIGKLVAETQAVFIVDSISGLGGLEMQQDEWSVDVLITASQKALMCPPGLALASVSEKAWEVIEQGKGKRRFYFDFTKARAQAGEGQTPFTSPVSHVAALHEALTMIHEEGWDQVLERHRQLAKTLKDGCEKLGLVLFPKSPIVSDTVGVFLVPDGLDAKPLAKGLKQEHRMILARTQTDAGQRVLRIGTMGSCTMGDIEQDLHAIESIMKKIG